MYILGSTSTEQSCISATFDNSIDIGKAFCLYAGVKLIYRLAHVLCASRAALHNTTNYSKQTLIGILDTRPSMLSSKESEAIRYRRCICVPGGCISYSS
ncbi:hypothetical protein AMS68_006306 [Peltaster fructicola]|uniref:Uncharacterized protein n=1 Tax=Peltaster fructicola TaxID=286661 RepID=A0A6H0Y1P6_9PEZI|nr:hypothetical protein AMS68_006306 [Peltaster fructicola]